jgi:hypothetical protein
MPETANTTVRGPSCSTAARNYPAPRRSIWSHKAPFLRDPSCEFAPKPSAFREKPRLGIAIR